MWRRQCFPPQQPSCSWNDSCNVPAGSELSSPSCHSSNDNYENHEDLNTSTSSTKVETNNNCDTASTATFHPPSVDRRLKPERSVVSSPTNTIQGPPVERNRKPR